MTTKGRALGLRVQSPRCANCVFFFPAVKGKSLTFLSRLAGGDAQIENIMALSDDAKSMHTIAMEAQAQVDEVMAAKNELSEAATDLADEFKKGWGHGDDGVASGKDDITSSTGLLLPPAEESAAAGSTTTVLAGNLVFASPGPPLTSPGPPHIYPPWEIEAKALDVGTPREFSSARVQQLHLRPLWHIVGPRG